MSSLRRLWFPVVLLLAAATVVGVLIIRHNEQNPAPSSAPTTLTIGAILPLTPGPCGPDCDLASYGQDTRHALELALDLQNAKGPVRGGHLQLRVEDSQGVAAAAVTSFQKLVDSDAIVACLGPITSPEVLSVAPVANTRRVPIISPSATGAAITTQGAYVFRTINVDSLETEVFAKYVKATLGLDTVAILADPAAGTNSYAESFERFYRSQGGQVLTRDTLPQGTVDYRSTIAKVLAKRPRAIYIAGVSTEIGQAVRQIRTVDKGVQLLSYQSAEDHRVVDIAGAAVNGLTFSSTTLPKEALGSPNQAFVTSFSQRFGHPPGVFAAEIFDGFNIVADALRRCPQSATSDLAGCIQATNGFPGASGEITFDANGDVHKPVAFYRYAGNSPTLLALGK